MFYGLLKYLMQYILGLENYVSNPEMNIIIEFRQRRSEQTSFRCRYKFEK